MQGFKAISLCQVGPNGEDRLITGPPGDEWVGQAVTPACGCWWADLHEEGVLVYGNQGTMNMRDKYLGTWVIFGREQVCSSRMHAGIHSQVKPLMPGLASRGYSTLTTWSANRLHLNHHQNAFKFEALASEASGGLSHHQSTRAGSVLETIRAIDPGQNYPGNHINAAFHDGRLNVHHWLEPLLLFVVQLTWAGPHTSLAVESWRKPMCYGWFEISLKLQWLSVAGGSVFVPVVLLVGVFILFYTLVFSSWASLCVFFFFSRFFSWNI